MIHLKYLLFRAPKIL